MNDNQQNIRTLQQCHDTNPNLTGEDKAAIQAGITALRKDQVMEVLTKLLPLLGTVAGSLMQHHK
jgi:hypothetical protein